MAVRPHVDPRRIETVVVTLQDLVKRAEGVRDTRAGLIGRDPATLNTNTVGGETKADGRNARTNRTQSVSLCLVNYVRSKLLSHYDPFTTHNKYI